MEEGGGGVAGRLLDGPLGHKVIGRVTWTCQLCGHRDLLDEVPYRPPPVAFGVVFDYIVGYTLPPPLTQAAPL